jgi:HlyD family secretion protein
VPGQRFHARIFIRRAQQGISIPNVALIAESGHTYVQVEDGSRIDRREVLLGARGTARSEVTKGLAAGDRVLLTPRSKGGSS